jgi:lactoylglutathione lyase
MKWDHCGIRAGDLERSLRFYTDVLGLELLEVVTVLDQPFYFVGNDTVRIEIEQANPAQIAAATGPQAGLYHLAFEVDDLEGAADRLRDAGAQFLLPPSQFREDRKIAFILDPDGVFIQLIQYLNRTS